MKEGERREKKRGSVFRYFFKCMGKDWWYVSFTMTSHGLYICSCRLYGAECLILPMLIRSNMKQGTQ